MPILHPATRHPLVEFAPGFTQPAHRRFATLLRTVGPLASGSTDYQRVLSRTPWSGPRLGCVRAGLNLDHLAPDGPVILVGDDTVDGDPGKHVCGKSRHRYPTRWAHAYTAYRPSVTGQRHVFPAVAALPKRPRITAAVGSAPYPVENQ